MKHKIYTLISIIVVAGILLSAYIFGKNTSTEQPEVKKSYYIALGDSIASGYGLDTPSDSSACNRTEEAYPNLIASKKNYELTNLACSGASYDAGILKEQLVNGARVSAQIDQIKNKNTPQLISITAGANDIGWTKILAKCLTATCGDNEDTKTIATNIATTKLAYTDFLTRLQNDLSSATPVVAITGYYQVFAEEYSTCTDIAGITSSEASWWREQTNALNSMLRSSAKDFSFVNFIDINFSGHELCSKDSWVQNLRSLGVYHPTVDGQKAIANSILSDLDTLK